MWWSVCAVQSEVADARRWRKECEIQTDERASGLGVGAHSSNTRPVLSRREPGRLCEEVPGASGRSRLTPAPGGLRRATEFEKRDARVASPPSLSLARASGETRKMRASELSAAAAYSVLTLSAKRARTLCERTERASVCPPLAAATAAPPLRVRLCVRQGVRAAAVCIHRRLSRCPLPPGARSRLSQRADEGSPSMRRASETETPREGRGTKSQAKGARRARERKEGDAPAEAAARRRKREGRRCAQGERRSGGRKSRRATTTTTPDGASRKRHPSEHRGEGPAPL